MHELLVAALNNSNPLNTALLIYIVFEVKAIKRRLSDVEKRKADKVDGKVVTTVMLSDRVH